MNNAREPGVGQLRGGEGNAVLKDQSFLIRDPHTGVRQISMKFSQRYLKVILVVHVSNHLLNQSTSWGDAPHMALPGQRIRQIMQTDICRGSTLHVFRYTRRQHWLLGSFQASRRGRTEQWGEDRSLHGEKHSVTGANRVLHRSLRSRVRDLTMNPREP